MVGDKKRVFIVLLFSVFAVILGVGIVAPLMALYAKDLGASGVGLGMIFSGFFIARIIFVPLLGRISDRKGRKVCIACGLLVYALLSLCYLQVQNVSQLIMVRLLNGIASAMVLPISMAYIGEISPKGREGFYMGSFNISLFLGFGLGPFIGGFLADHFGMASVFYALGILSTLALTLVVFFLPELGLHEKAGQKDPSFGRLLRDNLARGLLIFRGTTALGSALFMPFLPLFATSIRMSLSQMGMIFSINTLLTSLLQIPFGKLADKHNKVKLIVIGGGISSLVFLLIPKAQNFSQLLLITGIGSVAGALSLPAGTALNVELGRNYGMGSTMGVLDTSMSIGMIIGPLAGGLLMDIAGLNFTFYLGGIIGFLGVMIFSQLNKNEKDWNYCQNQ